MIKQSIQSFILLIIFSFLMGCAQKNISLPDDFWKDHKQKVVVASTKAPEPQLFQIGQEGLLDFAINSMMTHQLDNYLNKLDLSWYHQLPRQFSAQLTKRHISNHFYDKELKANVKADATIAAEIDHDKLLILRLTAIGAIRQYYAFIPMDAPKGFCEMSGELIDTKTNQVLWRHRTSVTQPVVGVWDQPPNYPNLTKAIKEAVATAKDELVGSFFSGH